MNLIDAWIFVAPLDEAIRIRAEERGADALSAGGRLQWPKPPDAASEKAADPDCHQKSQRQRGHYTNRLSSEASSYEETLDECGQEEERPRRHARVLGWCRPKESPPTKRHPDERGDDEQEPADRPIIDVPNA